MNFTNYDSQGIQQQGRQIDEPSQERSNTQESGKGKASKSGKEKPWWQGKGNQINRDPQLIRGYWMTSEIRLHANRSVYPDWGVIADRYIENKRRDHKAFYIKHRDAQIKYKQDYRRRDCVKKRSAELQKARIANSPHHKVRHNLSRRLANIMNAAGLSKNASILKYIGCSPSQLRNHIESQFTRGMTWGNYGAHWHVDHIIPCASFDHTDDKQVKQCWHWTNLRPLRAEENYSKSDNITLPQMNLLLCSHY